MFHLHSYHDIPDFVMCGVIIHMLTQGQLYAIPQLKYTSKGVPDDFCKVEYSEIQPQQKTQSEHSSPDNFEQNSIGAHLF